MDGPSLSGLGPISRANARCIAQVDQNLWVLMVGIFISAATDQILEVVGTPWRLSDLDFLLTLQNTVGWTFAAITLSRFTLKYIVLQNSFPHLEINDKDLRTRKRIESLATVKLRDLQALARASLWLIATVILLVITLVLKVLGTNGAFG